MGPPRIGDAVHHAIRRAAALIATLCIVLVLATAPAGAARSDPGGRSPSLERLKQQVAAAKAAANAAAARVAAAQSRYDRLNDEIARLERQVGGQQATMEKLSRIAVGRAISAYEGSSPGVAQVFGQTTDVLESARRAHLLGEVTKQDTETISRLGVAASDLRDRQAELTAKKKDQARALAAVRAEDQALQAKLADSQRALKALQARLASEASARRAAAAAGRPFAGPVVIIGGLVCPLPGSAFTDTWGAPRPGGRSHQGTDMMAPFGAPNVAIVSGTVFTQVGGLGGLALFIRGDDGNLYYYAHLSAFSVTGGRVQQGQLVGWTGNSGDAAGGPPHTHFQLHPGGGAPVDPYPTLRRIC